MSEQAQAVRELDGGWLQAKAPLPYSLKWVNAYLLPDESGWTLIDPGLRTEETEAFWSEALAARSIPMSAIHSIVVTHHHPDHYGMAGWFQQRTGATVWMSPVAFASAGRLWGEGESFSRELTEAFCRHGLPKELEEGMNAHMRGFPERVSPQPSDVRLISPGDRFTMGGIEWDVYGAEGHAPGHLLFYDRSGGKLLCGDAVLPDISPNIGWMPGGDPDPLQSFLESLRALRALEVSMAYPGHRNPFEAFSQRVGELLEHHERRLRRMEELLGDSGLTAFELCELLFGARLRGNMHNLRFALAETIAHLVRLEDEGRIARNGEADGQISFAIQKG
ncbi:MBL fold metallo-hydrolase [Cohnella boryungensis]|uniref:MBL fold metallo-hydrolase n=1 Tax=Cohnella boryungensis TaxID=768479 RepID=A0ABV8SGI3_9BACL